jgi:hypothetical protein
MKRSVCLNTKVICECTCLLEGEQSFAQKAVKNRKQFHYLYEAYFIEGVHNFYRRGAQLFHKPVRHFTILLSKG